MSKNEIREMRALSVIQPWAHCIVKKGKNVENRKWRTNKRGYVLIHASVRYTPFRFDQCREEYSIHLGKEDVSFGAIVGVAKIVDVVTRKDITKKTVKWFGGKYGIVLEDISYLREPIMVKGMLGFWRVNGRVLKRVLGQLSTSKKSRISKNLLTKAS